MSYVFNSTERYVKDMYETANIFDPIQLNPETLAESLNLSVYYLPTRSWRIDNQIFLDSRISSEVQWEEFCHELCHALWHPDNQFHLSKAYIEYQEKQANNFALYACIPTDMLMAMDMPNERRSAVHRMMQLFNVSRQFAERRLDLHIEKMNQLTYN